MKKHIFRSISALLFTCSLTAGSHIATAQSLRTGYFSDSYLYRHQMNPALANTSGYVSMPALGNFTLSTGSNFGVKDFIFKQKDGGLTTFMNGDIDANKFLGNLEEDNLLTMNLDMAVLSVGFNAGGGYNTIDVGVHTRAGLNLPKSLFAFMKQMESNHTYDLSDMEANTRTYVDLSLGHSRNINDELRVGAKVKALFGILYGNAKFNDTKATFGEDKWMMKMHGKVEMAMGGRFTADEEGKVDGYDDFAAGINGFGLAVDLGATYDMHNYVEGLTLSAALTDLGYIKWKDVAVANADGTPFEFDGFKDMSMHDGKGSGSLDDQWKDIEDDLEDMYSLTPEENLGNLTEALGATLTLGAEYTLPVYKKISFGMLYTQRFAKLFKYAEGRAHINYAPSRAFDLAFSGHVSTYGAGFGVLANVHCPGFNLFVGTDRCYCGSVNSDMVPLDRVSSQVSMGINFPFGF